MKTDIHPEYIEAQATCRCGISFTTHGTVTSGSIRLNVCSQCHPFYTGKQKALDTGGRVARFEARYAKKAAAKKKYPAGVESAYMSAPAKVQLHKVFKPHRFEPYKCHGCLENVFLHSLR